MILFMSVLMYSDYSNNRGGGIGINRSVEGG